MAPSPTTARTAVAMLLALLVSGATASRSEVDSSVDAPRPDPSAISTARWSGVQLVVYKSKRRLAVYRDGGFEKEVPVVLGLAPSGRKRHENDARTPEGRYRVVSKRAHDRWQVFLAIDYPNAKDRERYESEVASGTMPGEDGRPFAIGGGLGLHGTDRPDDQARGVDWTKGCIALSAADIAEIEATVPVGSMVWIVE